MSNLLTPRGVVLDFELKDGLRKAREHAGLEQQQLAELLGIHRQSVARYEHGDAVPRKPVLTTWAIVTGVDLDWLEELCARRDSNPQPSDLYSPVDRWSPGCPVTDAAFWNIVRQLDLDNEIATSGGVR